VKKLISYIILAIFVSNLVSIFNINITKADSGDCFVVTAYYSPLPNQNYYFKGTYDADIILN
jgi:hypothetical protein